jgi:hypothetical protein
VISLFRWLLYDVTALLCPFGCDTDGDSHITNYSITPPTARWRWH